MAMTERSFGWVLSPPDARDYPMAVAVQELEEVPLADRHWPCRIVLDQGEEPECVGFSWAHWGDCAPVEQKWGNPMGRSIYAACKKVDGDPKGRGTTLRAGAKVMLARNRIKTYFWARDVQELLEYVSRWGPVVIGSHWYAGMSKPSLFNATIRPSGKDMGGHAYLICGVQWKRKRARIHNSWGAEWGDGGECWISIPDLERVWSEGAEACAATEKPLTMGGTV